MNHDRLSVAALALSAIVLSGACAGRITNGGGSTDRPRAAAGASTLGADNCDPRNRNATLAGRIVLTFSGAAAGEATVRVEGESYRSTVRVDVATGTTLELREDEYRLRITVPEHRAVEKTIRVVCGKEQALPIALSRR